MRAIITSVLVLAMTMPLAGCIVSSRGRTSSRSSAVSRDCPPAHHWENGACVHNGKAKGHYK
jgi:hypothetical protein